MPKKSRSKKHPNIKKNSLPFRGWGIVGFFDLLGFSSSVFSDWNNLERNPVERLLSVKAAPGIGTHGIAFQAHEGEGGDPIGPRYLPTVHSISDSISLSVGLPSDVTPMDLLLAFSCISANARFVCQAAIREGFVVRGGIELGQIYWSASEIIGPALINAYMIESKVAKTARVILGPKILQGLTELEGVNAEAARILLMKSEDGLVALSPRQIVTGNDKSGIDYLEQVKELRNRCVRDDHKIKYDELLKVLSEPETICVPTMADLDASCDRFLVSGQL